MNPKTSRDFSSLIGIPYDGCNCWELAKRFYALCLDAKLISYFDDTTQEDELAEKLISTNRGDFNEVQSPKFGDIIILTIAGLECHVGIYIDHEFFLHTTKAHGSVMERNHRYKKLVVGYYRMKDT